VGSASEWEVIIAGNSSAKTSILFNDFESAMDETPSFTN